MVGSIANERAEDAEEKESDANVPGQESKARAAATKDNFHSTTRRMLRCFSLRENLSNVFANKASAIPAIDGIRYVALRVGGNCVVRKCKHK